MKEINSQATQTRECPALPKSTATPLRRTGLAFAQAAVAGIVREDWQIIPAVVAGNEWT